MLYTHILAIILSIPANAEKQTRSNAPLLLKSYTWHDGDREKTVWLDPAFLAEFKSSADSPGKSPIRAFSDRSKKPKLIGATLVWPLSSANGGKSATESLSSTNLQGTYSEVFRDSPRATSGMRALPGNIIVYFRPDWSEAKIMEWTTSQKMDIVRKFEFGANIYVLKSKPGLASLIKANEILASGEVVHAFPDWWIDLKPL